MHISCKPITEKGKEALLKAIEDNKKVMSEYSFAQRQEFQKIWLEVIVKDPLKYTIVLRARSSLGASYHITKHFTKSVNSAREFNTGLDDKFKSMVDEIDKSMIDNGAIPLLDYVTEVVK